MQVGKSHTLVIREGITRSIKRQGLQLIVTLGPGESGEDRDVIDDVRSHMRTILRKEAKAHLPKRISHLADIHGFTFSSLRFTHASSRWGSCNSNKAISLNIALMNLPFELIDYVLLHELAHTKHLNHSKSFWDEVARTDNKFALHRRELKRYNPAI
jgi:predicted metal-dependent hydrolase